MKFIQIIDFYYLSKIPLESSLRKRTSNNDSSDIDLLYSFPFADFCCAKFLSLIFGFGISIILILMKIFLLIIMTLQIPTIMCKTFEILKITQNEKEQKKTCFLLLGNYWLLLPFLFSRGNTTLNFEIFVQLPKFVRS